jgi:transcriptional regulator with XRE-family HTH domain
MSFDAHISLDDLEQQLGARFRAARIQAELDQASLARLANVSEGAVKALESGRGSTVKTMLKILRALDRTDWLDAFAPPVSVSPLQALKGVTTPRQRVSRNRERR